MMKILDFQNLDLIMIDIEFREVSMRSIFQFALIILFIGSTVLTSTVKSQSLSYLCSWKRSKNDLSKARWYPEDLPLEIYLAPPPDYPTPNRSTYVNAVIAAFRDWEQYAPVFAFKFVDSPKKADITIKWKKHFTIGAWGTAYLPFLRNSGTNTHRSIITLAIYAQPGSAIIPGAVPFDLPTFRSVATHEVGHSLGLSHSDGKSDVMSIHVPNMLPTARKSISARDVATLRHLYSLPKVIKKHPCY